MSVKYSDFQGEIVGLVKKFPFYANVNAELTAIAAAAGADTQTHDVTIETSPAQLQITPPSSGPWLSTFSILANILINKAQGGNLPAASVKAAIDGVIGVLSAPGVIDIPYASANASPPIVGTTLSVTNGNWAGTPTSYTYQWKRDGANIAAATNPTYVLVSADTGAEHQLTCVVTATNATGSTAAPPSNAIQVP